MKLFPALLAAHLIGDWIVQTDWQAANKTSSWDAMMQHMVGYHACILLAILATWPNPGPRGHVVAAAAIATISLLTHGFIDRRWPVRWLMRHTGSAAFSETTWGVLVVDQALHLSILCVLAAVFAQ